MFTKAMEYGFRSPTSFEEWIKLESVGWGKYFNYWMTEEETKLLQSINMTSYIAFPAAIQKISHPLLRMLFYIYQPIAKFRFKHGFYAFHLEKYLLQEKDAINF